MIRALLSYGTDEVRPRLRAIFGGSEFWIALVLAALIGMKGDRWLMGEIKVSDAVLVLLTYCAIALGFCVAGLTIALTLPDREFVKRLATHKTDKRKENAYSDLFFVFSWTAVCHWAAILGLVLSLALNGPDRTILSAGDTLWRRIGVGGVLFLCTYSFGQFLITLITLSQVGRRYVDSLRE